MQGHFYSIEKGRLKATFMRFFDLKTSKKTKVIIGMLFCLAGLILLHWNIVIVGLPLFIVGFLVMNGLKWPWKPR